MYTSIIYLYIYMCVYLYVCIYIYTYLYTWWFLGVLFQGGFLVTKKMLDMFTIHVVISCCMNTATIRFFTEPLSPIP